MPEQSLNLIKIHSSLNQPRCKSVAKIMEVKVRDLCGLERTDKPSTEVAAVQGSGRLTNEDDIVL